MHKDESPPSLTTEDTAGLQAQTEAAGLSADALKLLTDAALEGRLHQTVCKRCRNGFYYAVPREKVDSPSLTVKCPKCSGYTHVGTQRAVGNRQQRRAAVKADRVRAAQERRRTELELQRIRKSGKPGSGKALVSQVDDRVVIVDSLK